MIEKTDGLVLTYLGLVIGMLKFTSKIKSTDISLILVLSKSPIDLFGVSDLNQLLLTFLLGLILMLIV